MRLTNKINIILSFIGVGFILGVTAPPPSPTTQPHALIMKIVSIVIFFGIGLLNFSPFFEVTKKSDLEKDIDAIGEN